MKEQLLTILENSKNYTLAVADAMPENLYSTKPVDTVFSFAELMNHIAYGIEWWRENYMNGTNTDWNPPVAKKTKKELITYLQNAYASLQETVAGNKTGNDIAKGFHATLDHITHHRGQATLHLRLHGITPPDYLY